MFGWLTRRPRFIQPAPLQHYRFVQLNEDSFEVWRDGRCVVGNYSGVTLPEISDRYAAEERHERQTRKAFASTDPRSLCRLGWHRRPNGAFVRFGAGKSDSLRIYRTGRMPFDYACTTIWAHGQPVWICSVCKQPIDAEHGRNMLS